MHVSCMYSFSYSYSYTTTRVSHSLHTSPENQESLGSFNLTLDRVRGGMYFFSLP